MNIEQYNYCHTYMYMACHLNAFYLHIIQQYISFWQSSTDNYPCCFPKWHYMQKKHVECVYRAVRCIKWLILSASILTSVYRCLVITPFYKIHQNLKKRSTHIKCAILLKMIYKILYYMFELIYSNFNIYKS